MCLTIYQFSDSCLYNQIIGLHHLVNHIARVLPGVDSRVAILHYVIIILFNLIIHAVEFAYLPHHVSYLNIKHSLYESFVYPIYRSLRIFRKKEEQSNRPKILKFW